MNVLEKNYSFTHEWVEKIFRSTILPNVRQYWHVGLRCFNPSDLTKDDVWEIQDALKAELGRRYVVEPKRKITHVTPDGMREYSRRREIARKHFDWWNWPANWYDAVRILGYLQEEDDNYTWNRYYEEMWAEDYPSVDAFWDAQL